MKGDQVTAIHQYIMIIVVVIMVIIIIIYNK